jgi:hypothetical protein
MMEYYLSMKRNEVMMQVTTQMNLEILMLSERKASFRKDYILYDFIYMKR